MTRTCCDSRPRRSAWWRRSSIDATRSRSASTSRWPSAGDAHRVRAPELEQLTAGGDQRLRRDAVPEVRGTTDDVALDQRDVGAECGRDARARVARGTATEDDDIRHTLDMVRAEATGSGQRNVVVMSDVRHDPVTGRVVIMAADRATRPHTLAQADRDEDRGPEECPFCPGHESMTPPEILRTGDGVAGEPGWRVRVFPNLYPITEAHEVVVLSPDHDRTFGDLSDDAAARGAHGAARPRAGAPRCRSPLRHRHREPGTRRGRVDRAPARTGLRRSISSRPTSPPRSTGSWPRPTTCSTTTSPTRVHRDLVVRDGAVAVWCPSRRRRRSSCASADTEADTTFDSRDRRRGRRHRRRRARRPRRRSEPRGPSNVAVQPRRRTRHHGGTSRSRPG